MGGRREAESRIIRFGSFEADLAEGRLTKAGVRIRLQEQPFQILVLLLERSGQLVTREEIREKLWSNHTFVEFDDALNTAVRKLRAELCDSADNPRFLETVPRRGYRFVAPVSSFVEGAQTQTMQEQKSASELPDPSIVVLPFANLSSDAEGEFFADGITEEITNALAQVEALRVVARTSASSFKNKQVDLRTIATTLNVNTILEGSVRMSGNRVRIVAQLISAGDGYHIWSERYDRELQDVFDVQDEIARTIANRLKATLGTGVQAPLVKIGTKNLEAYQFYLKGRFHWNKRTAEGLCKAIDYLQEAIAKDPDYAVAYAGLADAYNIASFRNVFAPLAAMPKAKQAAERALALDSRLAEAHVSLAYANFTFDRDWPAAESHFVQALALNRAYVLGHAFYPLYLSSCGRCDESISLAKRALDLDPAAPAVSHVLSVQLYLARRFDDAIAQCQQTLEMDPNYEPAYAVVGQTHATNGRYQDAIAPLEKHMELTRSSPLARALLGYTYARAGQTTAARKVIEDFVPNAENAFVPAICFALVYTGLGDNDQAFAWLEKTGTERSNRLAYIKVEPLWDPLRSDSRFPDFLERMGLSFSGS